MDRFDLKFGDIRSLLDLVRHHYAHLSQEEDHQVEGPLSRHRNAKLALLQVVMSQLTLTVVMEDLRLSTTPPIPDASPFQTMFSAVPPSPIHVEGVSTIFLAVSNSLPLYETKTPHSTVF